MSGDTRCKGHKHSAVYVYYGELVKLLIVPGEKIVLVLLTIVCFKAHSCKVWHSGILAWNFCCKV